MKPSESELTFEEAYIKNYDMLIRICQNKVSTADAEDIVSETFLLLFKKWDSFDNHSEKVLTAWLCNTIRFKCLEHNRKAYRNSTEELTEIFPDADSLGMKEDLLYRDYISEVQRRLSPAELAAFNCIVVEHMSLKEAAEYLEISQITLRVRWSRTREHIKKTIGSIIGFG